MQFINALGAAAFSPRPALALANYDTTMSLGMSMAPAKSQAAKTTGSFYKQASGGEEAMSEAKLEMRAPPQQQQQGMASVGQQLDSFSAARSDAAVIHVQLNMEADFARKVR